MKNNDFFETEICEEIFILFFFFCKLVSGLVCTAAVTLRIAARYCVSGATEKLSQSSSSSSSSLIEELK